MIVMSLFHGWFSRIWPVHNTSFRHYSSVSGALTSNMLQHSFFTNKFNMVIPWRSVFKTFTAGLSHAISVTVMRQKMFAAIFDCSTFFTRQYILAQKYNSFVMLVLFFQANLFMAIVARCVRKFGTTSAAS